jgi:hypothetical protein
LLKNLLENKLMGMSGKETRLHARVDANLKAQLEIQAAKENMPFGKWLQAHLPELLNQYPGQISVENDIPIQNPGGYIPPQPISPNAPYPSYPPYPQYYPSFQQHQPQPDAIDQLVNEMRKIYVAKMLKDLLKEDSSTSKDALFELMRAQKGDFKRDDMSMTEIMKMNMLQNQIDRQYDREMARANQALELAKGKGDKQGEQNALQLITALTTAQMQQQQNFMQQFMLANQNASQTQQTLFTTALQSNRSQEEAARQERSEFNQQINQIQNQMTQNQLSAMEKLSEMQLTSLQGELERIRNDPKKDPITQLIELDMLRKNSPILDAAFKGAFGVKEGGGIGELLPKLKELGIDKVIDGAVSALKSVVIRPPQQGPGGIPPPVDITPQGIPPVEPPSVEELQSLHLPPEQRPPRTETVPLEDIPDNVGYSNIQKAAAVKTETVELEQPTETVIVEPQPYIPPTVTPPKDVTPAPAEAEAEAEPSGYNNLNANKEENKTFMAVRKSKKHS